MGARGAWCYAAATPVKLAHPSPPPSPSCLDGKSARTAANTRNTHATRTARRRAPRQLRGVARDRRAAVGARALRPQAAAHAVGAHGVAALQDQRLALGRVEVGRADAALERHGCYRDKHAIVLMRGIDESGKSAESGESRCVCVCYCSRDWIARAPWRRLLGRTLLIMA